MNNDGTGRGAAKRGIGGASERRLAGMILAAGFGERMLPLTARVPKALLPILGVPLIEIAAGKLERSGAAEIHCNLFHLPGPIDSYAERSGRVLRFHREPELLGTGGGIGNMAESVAGFGSILLHNVDIVSDIEFGPALAFHESRGALVTMILVRSGPPANVLVSGGEVLAITEARAAAGRADRSDEAPRTAGPDRAERRESDGADSRIEAPGGEGSLLGYTGLAILSPEALRFFPRGERMGLVPILTEMIRLRRGSVAAYDASAERETAWGEAGSPAGFLDIHRRILIDKVRFDPKLAPPALPLHVGSGAEIDPGASWRGFLEVGPRAVVGRRAVLEDCVLLEGAVVEAGEHREEIIFDRGKLDAKEAPDDER